MITVLAVGKIKENFLAQGLAEYQKRLSRFTKLSLVEVTDEYCDVNEEAALAREGERLLKKIPPGAYVITLEIGGNRLSSPAFAEKLNRLFTEGNSHICFIIGGSVGLSAEVRHRADYSLSFSDMTFPHQLFRLLLLEQIYRAFKINSNETYHK